MVERSTHEGVVDEWLARRFHEPEPEALAELFNRGSAALWECCKATLGEVTLTAIVGRVLLVSVERYPTLGSLFLDPVMGIRAPPSLAAVGIRHEAELAKGLRFVLVETLRLLGNLTAGILVEELHATLRAPRAEATTRGKRGRRAKRNDAEPKSGRRR